MAIQLQAPQSNTKIPSRFIALGTKAEGDPRPAGVLLGLQGKDGALDENRVVGGTTLVLRDKSGKEVKDRWAIAFDLSKAPKGEYYSLRLYNPAGFGAQNQGKLLFDSDPVCTNLQVGADPQIVSLPKGKKQSLECNGGGGEIIYPTAQSHPSANEVVADGFLPEGDYDVDPDPTKTYIYCPDCDGGNPSYTALSYSSVGFSGDYYAYFDQVVNGSGKTVTIRITYLDSGTHDDVTCTLS